MSGRLIVNADDYGLTDGIARGILRAHREGIVSSTSVIALGPALDRTASWLDDAPELGVGLHLAAVGEDPPLLTAPEIPTLVDGRGRLARSWKVFLRRAALGAVDRADLAREFAAQAERAAALDRPLTHVDTHQHLHLWPVVRQVVLELAVAREIPAVRLPRSAGGRLAGVAVNWLAGGLARDARTAGLATPDAFAGFDEAGRLDAARRDAALARFVRAFAGAPGGVAELCCHPGEADDPARARYDWGYAWADELAALTGDAARRAVTDRGLELATFADLEPVPAEGADDLAGAEAAGDGADA